MNMVSYNNKNPFFPRFTLQEVLAEPDKVLLSELEADLPRKPLRSGAQMRVNTLRTLCQLMESQNRKLSQIHDLLLDIKKKQGDF